MNRIIFYKEYSEKVDILSEKLQFLKWIIMENV